MHMRQIRFSFAFPSSRRASSSGSGSETGPAGGEDASAEGLPRGFSLGQGLGLLSMMRDLNRLQRMRSAPTPMSPVVDNEVVDLTGDTESGSEDGATESVSATSSTSASLRSFSSSSSSSSPRARAAATSSSASASTSSRSSARVSSSSRASRGEAASTSAASETPQRQGAVRGSGAQRHHHRGGHTAMHILMHGRGGAADFGMPFFNFVPFHVTGAGPGAGAEPGGLDLHPLDDLLSMLFRAVPHAPAGPPPAAKKTVRTLKTQRVTEAMRKRQPACPICLENFSPKAKVCELKCEHVFHPKCVKTWLKTRNTCPVCRYELETDHAEYEATRKEHNASYEAAFAARKRKRASSSGDDGDAEPGSATKAKATPGSSRARTKRVRKSKANASSSSASSASSNSRSLTRTPGSKKARKATPPSSSNASPGSGARPQRSNAKTKAKAKAKASP